MRAFGRSLSKTVSLAVFPVIFSFSMSFFALVKFLGVVPRQRWSPAKPDPLLDVVGQARPEHFQQHLGQTAQTELAQSQFFLDPGIGKFSHRAPLTVDFLGFGGLHLLQEPAHLWCFHRPDDRASLVGVLRT